MFNHKIKRFISMIRYLLHVSYIGTAFRGVTYIEPYYSYRDLRTVQGALENAVKFLFKKRCEVVCSSRTDARVHALASTFHVDVNDVENTSFTVNDKCKIITTLNDNLKFLRAAVRINDVAIVDEGCFEAYRNVKCRSYLYRLAVKPTAKKGEFTIPIEEVDRCYVIENDEFDIEKFKRAAQLFIGTHDFRSFMRYSKEDKTKESCYAQRRIYSVTVEDSKPCVLTPHLEMCQKHFKFYDVTFTGRSFVYRQIRRIIGSLCALAEGRITERNIYELLTIPSFRTWHELADQDLIRTAPACALYFIGIDYKPKEQQSLKSPEKTVRGTRVKSHFVRNVDQ